jgi:large subunit ribosomal protein L29
MKPKDIKALKDAELDGKLDDYKQELFNLRWQSASHQNQNPKRAREVRKNIARILTVKNARQQGKA